MTDPDRFFDKFVYYVRPLSPEEEALRAEIDALTPTRVKAGDSADLTTRGFREGECHRNCVAAAAAGDGDQVFGWTVTSHIYFSHSVMRMPDGSLQCITPGHIDELDGEGCFLFCEDPAYSFDGRWMRRNGVFPARSTAVIRRDPDLVRGHYTELQHRVTSCSITFEAAVELGL